MLYFIRLQKMIINFTCRAHLTHSLISIISVIIVPGLSHMPHTPNNGAHKATLHRATQTHAILHIQHVHDMQANLQAPAPQEQEEARNAAATFPLVVFMLPETCAEQNLFGESCRCQVRQNICQERNTKFAFLLLHITHTACSTITYSKQANSFTSKTLH